MSTPSEGRVELKRPALHLVASYLEAVEEMRKLGEQIWPPTIPAPHESHDVFVKRLLRAESEPTPPLVPATTFWATVGENVVGRISLRHHLNADLAEFGGHIGYEVRPSARRQGVATEMLRLVLQTPKAREIGRLLLTCAPTNLASNKTITANGGVLERTIRVERINRDTNLYWITLSP